MDDDSLVKQVYIELQRLTEQSFYTWVSSLRKLADSYQLNAYVDPNKFRQESKTKVRSRFVDQWTADMNHINSYPIVRTYRHIKVIDTLSTCYFTIKMQLSYVTYREGTLYQT